MLTSNPQEESSTDSDGELDWSYSSRSLKGWSDDKLLNHLCSKAFTIPPRDYKPSSPFVSIKTDDGLTTILPHRYRLPLLFIVKYQWETTAYALALEDRQRWDALRKELFHLSRLCHVLFMKARANAEKGGMDKAWRCVMFDRVLARFYKGTPGNSPIKLRSFHSRFGLEEYERNVVKHDWKRWVTKGLNSSSLSPHVHLTEREISDGITAADFKIRLSKIDNVWMLNTGTKRDPTWRAIPFIQATDDNQAEPSDKDDEPIELSPITNLNPPPPPPSDTPTKRGREDDDDTIDRVGKRVKMEEIVRTLTLPDGSQSAGVIEEEHAALPNFRVPRQTLSSHGWKQRLSAMDNSARCHWRKDQEQEQGEAETDVISACDPPSVSTPSSPNPTPIPQIPFLRLLDDILHSRTNPSPPLTPNILRPLDAPTDPVRYTANDAAAASSDESENSVHIIPPLSMPLTNEKAPMISRTPTPTSAPSQPKEKRPESTPALATASTHSTTITTPTTVPIPAATTTTTTTTTGTSTRKPKNVSKRAAKGVMLRIRAPVSEPPVHPPLTTEGTGGGEEEGIIGFDPPVIQSTPKVTHENSNVQDMLPPPPPPPTRRQLVEMLVQSHSQTPSSSQQMGTGAGAGAGDANVSGTGREGNKSKRVVRVQKGTKGFIKWDKNVDKPKKKSVGMQGLESSLPSSSSTLPNNSKNNSKNDEQGEVTMTTTTATSNTPLDPSHGQVSNLEKTTLGEGETKKKIRRGKAKVLDLEKNKSVISTPENSWPSLIPGSLPNSTTNNNDEQGEKTKTTTTMMTAAATAAAAIPTTSAVTLDTPPPHSQVSNLVHGLDPGRALVINPWPSVPLSGSNSLEANSGSETQRSQNRIRELQESRGIIGLVNGVEDGGGSRNGHVSQVAKEKGNGDLNVEMVDVSGSGSGGSAMPPPRYVDAAVGVDRLVRRKDAFVQTDEIAAQVHRSIVAASTTTLHEPDEGSRMETLPPQSRHAETVHQYTINDTAATLSNIIDNFVSAKMHSMVQTLGKSTNTNNKAKAIETTTTMATLADSDSSDIPPRQPSPSSSFSASHHSMDVYDNLMSNLLDELKTIKEEARCREQNEKEEMLAMRQLHSAEVDALRRRLSYLESRHLSSGRWESGGVGVGASGTGASVGASASGGGWRGSSMRVVDPSLDLDHHRFMGDGNNKAFHPTTSFRRLGERSSQNRHLQKGLGSRSSSTVNSEGELSVSHRPNNTTVPYTPLSLKKANLSSETQAPPGGVGGRTSMNAMIMSSPPTTTTTTSGINNHQHHRLHHHLGSSSKDSNGGDGGQANSMDVDDDLPLPLPVKSQRKHHIMALARAHFS